MRMLYDGHTKGRASFESNTHIYTSYICIIYNMYIHTILRRNMKSITFVIPCTERITR